MTARLAISASLNSKRCGTPITTKGHEMTLEAVSKPVLAEVPRMNTKGRKSFCFTNARSHPLAVLHQRPEGESDQKGQFIEES